MSRYENEEYSHERDEDESVDEWHERLNNHQQAYKEAAVDKHDADTNAAYESEEGEPIPSDGGGNRVQVAADNAFSEPLADALEAVEDASDVADAIDPDESEKDLIEALSNYAEKLDIVRPMVEDFLQEDGHE